MEFFKLFFVGGPIEHECILPQIVSRGAGSNCRLAVYKTATLPLSYPGVRVIILKSPRNWAESEAFPRKLLFSSMLQGKNMLLTPPKPPGNYGLIVAFKVKVITAGREFA